MKRELYKDFHIKDKEHRGLVTQFIELYECCNQLNESTLFERYMDVVAQIEEHNSSEVELMEALKYDDVYPHQRAHLDMKIQFDKRIKCYLGGIISAEQLMTESLDILCNHITLFDKDIDMYAMI